MSAINGLPTNSCGRPNSRSEGAPQPQLSGRGSGEIHSNEMSSTVRVLPWQLTETLANGKVPAPVASDDVFSVTLTFRRPR